VTEQQVPPTAPAPTAVDVDGQVLAGPYVQIVETNATPLEAAEALERPDAYGRVPVIVRIQRQPPIRVEFVLIAIALGASGLFLPLFLALRAVIIVAAVAALLVGFLARIFIRVPAGSVGLVLRSGQRPGVLEPGIHRVSPRVVLTHLVTTRELAFDVPVSEVRSSDGIAVTVDLLLTLLITAPLRSAYSITSSDLDQLVHASTQEAVRTLIRGTEALATLDLGTEEAARLRETIDAKLSAYGFALPSELMASVEARRLSAVQLIEEEQNFALEQRRISDRASLLSQEAQAKRSAIEHEADGEAIRLARLEQRLVANPRASTYDLETARLRVAQQLAGNSRAVVSVGGGQLLADLLLSREAALEAVPAAAPVAPVAAPEPTLNGGAVPDEPARRLRGRSRRPRDEGAAG
jgi:regulator of protease activity HflC (stomatin/prohibitin superfamily)